MTSTDEQKAFFTKEEETYWGLSSQDKGRLCCYLVAFGLGPPLMVTALLFGGYVFWATPIEKMAFYFNGDFGAFISAHQKTIVEFASLLSALLIMFLYTIFWINPRWSKPLGLWRPYSRKKYYFFIFMDIFLLLSCICVILLYKNII